MPRSGPARTGRKYRGHQSERDHADNYDPSQPCPEPSISMSQSICRSMVWRSGSNRAASGRQRSWQAKPACRTCRPVGAGLSDCLCLVIAEFGSLEIKAARSAGRCRTLGLLAALGRRHRPARGGRRRTMKRTATDLIGRVQSMAKHHRPRPARQAGSPGCSARRCRRRQWPAGTAPPPRPARRPRPAV